PPRLRLGAWVRFTSLLDKNYERHIEVAKQMGLSRLDVVINDYSVNRDETPFRIKSMSNVVRFAQLARQSCIDVHFMSWLMPHESFIKDAVPAVSLLMRDTEASSVIWDAEEAWTQARGGLPYGKAADLLGQLWPSDLRSGVTGIRYANKSKLAPLVEVTNYAVAQCYATGRNGYDPSTIAAKGLENWQQRFGDVQSFDFVPGLASSGQSGIKGHTPGSALIAAIEGAEEIECHEAIFWALDFFVASPALQRAAAGYTRDSQEAVA